MSLLYTIQEIHSPDLPWSQTWMIPILQFDDPVYPTLRLAAVGTIQNSVPSSARGRENLQAWKVRVASRVKERRGERAWWPEYEFSISIGLAFHPENHRGQKLDVENFSSQSSTR